MFFLHNLYQVNDFGFSRTKEYSQSTSLNKVRLGTSTHIPPENWNNAFLRKTEKFDVYGFGILIWEVITEQKPFNEGYILNRICIYFSRSKVVRNSNRLLAVQYWV